MAKAIQKVRELQRLKAWADEQRAARARAQRYISRPPNELLDYFGEINSHRHDLVKPTWLAPLAELFERAKHERVRAVVSAPPQHGKTELCEAALCQILETQPTKRNGYASYSGHRSVHVGNEIRAKLASRGVATEGAGELWRTKEGGYLLAAGIGGAITGFPVDGIFVVDDLLRDIEEARSKAIREKRIAQLKSSVITRLHPGVSIIVIATRWDVGDPSGVLIGEGWEHLNLAAVAEAGDPLGREIGEALAPQIRPLEFLLEQKRLIGDFFFDAMYQGRPRPMGGLVFHEPHFYSQLPRSYQPGYGVDLAYTAKSSADWSICVELWKVHENGRDRFYVYNVDRAQVEAPAFTLTLKARAAARPGTEFLWRASGTERGSAQFIRKQGIPLRIETPPGDKFVSAAEVAAAWNAGDVLVPSINPDEYPGGKLPPHAEAAKRWLPQFLASIGNFTGTGDEQDDDSDALGNAHRCVMRTQDYDGGGGAPSGR